MSLTAKHRHPSLHPVQLFYSSCVSTQDLQGPVLLSSVGHREATAESAETYSGHKAIRILRYTATLFCSSTPYQVTVPNAMDALYPGGMGALSAICGILQKWSFWLVSSADMRHPKYLNYVHIYDRLYRSFLSFSRGAARGLVCSKLRSVGMV